MESEKFPILSRRKFIASSEFRADIPGVSASQNDYDVETQII